MSEDLLKKVGSQIGITEENEQKARERRWKNAKAMTKKELESEVPKLRKMVTALERETDELKGEVPGVGCDPGAGLSLPPEMWGTIPGLLYEFLAIRFGDHWRLGENEIKIAGIHFEKVLNRYLPDVSTSHPELMAFGFVLIGITIPKAMVTIRLLREIRAKSEEKPKYDKKPKDAKK